MTAELQECLPSWCGTRYLGSDDGILNKVVALVGARSATSHDGDLYTHQMPNRVVVRFLAEPKEEMPLAY